MGTVRAGARGALRAGEGLGHSCHGRPTRTDATLRRPCSSSESVLGVLIDNLRWHFEKQTQSADESELLLAAEVEKRAGKDVSLGSHRSRATDTTAPEPLLGNYLDSRISYRSLEVVRVRTKPTKMPV